MADDRYPNGSIVSVTIDHTKLPPGITAHVNPDDTIEVSGTTTQVGQFALAVTMVGPTTDGQIETGYSSREVIVSGPLKIGTPERSPRSARSAFRTDCRSCRPA